ncbi:MAG: M24 family metallopeptidase [Gammaproteobacteria bacterium]|nr:M24 family metallopeptidase [Gammaproteobacteria bacterium]
MISRNDLYLKRMQKLRSTMIDMGVPALLIVDSVNILYATGASNMTIFSTRTPARYLLVVAEGPTVLFDYFGCEHLSKELPTIDQILPARGLCFVSSNGNIQESADGLAEDLKRTLATYSVNETRLAIDRFPLSVIDALREAGFELSNADFIFSKARRNKLPEEIEYMDEAMVRVQNAVSYFEAAIEPGRTENEIWGHFHHHLIASSGQYVSTRLMQSGENTFPYFQQCGPRRLKKGDLVCLDTDSIGFEGYAVDFSRTFLCGDGRPTSDQITLYQRAKEQLDHNVELIAPGTTFEEIANNAWSIPNEHQDSRYYCIAHGLGMSGEFPNIPFKSNTSPYPLTGTVEPGMVLCVESYIGSRQTQQGVKLEQQLLIEDNATRVMSETVFDDRLQGR